MPLANEVSSFFPPTQLRSLTCCIGWGFWGLLTTEWPFRPNPGVRALTQSSTVSLQIVDIASRKAAEEASRLLVDNKQSLKVLKLQFSHKFAADELELITLNPIIELQSQLRLHSLDLRMTTLRGFSNWFKAFDFTSI
jgi:hypothetical protein